MSGTSELRPPLARPASVGYDSLPGRQQQIALERLRERVAKYAVDLMRKTP